MLLATALIQVANRYGRFRLVFSASIDEEFGFYSRKCPWFPSTISCASAMACVTIKSCIDESLTLDMNALLGDDKK